MSHQRTPTATRPSPLAASTRDRVGAAAPSDEFSFEHATGSYRCYTEARCGPSPERWWWFEVSGDRQRYAPFRTAEHDIEADVRSRVVVYYADLLARRAGFSADGGHSWRSRRRATAAAAAFRP
jgi:hypothetical protein